MTLQPPEGSPLELMSEADRGTMCDTCFTHSHNEHEIELEHSTDAKKQSVMNIFTRTKDAYLLAHQVSKGVTHLKS